MVHVVSESLHEAASFGVEESNSSFERAGEVGVIRAEGDLTSTSSPDLTSKRPEGTRRTNPGAKQSPFVVCRQEILPGAIEGNVDDSGKATDAPDDLLVFDMPDHEVDLLIVMT